MKSHKELNKNKYSRKKADRRSNNVFHSRSYGSSHYGRGSMRIQDRSYHHARRGMIDSMLKSDYRDDLEDTDLKRTMVKWKYCSTNFNKKINLLRDNDKKINNRRAGCYLLQKPIRNKIAKFLETFLVAYCYQLDQSMQPRYITDNNLLNTHLEHYIQGKAKSVVLPITAGEVTKQLNDAGYNVLDIYENMRISEQYKLAYSAITTIYPFKPEAKLFYCRSNYNNSYCFEHAVSEGDSGISLDIKKNGYANLQFYVELKLFGYKLYLTSLFTITVDNNMKDYTFYYLGSEGGALAHCKGYDIKEAQEASFMVEDHGTEPKQQEHYKEKTVERNSLNDDDDKTSYEMGKLIFKNLVKEI